ncbi:MAG: hypothetical protein V1913_07345 [Fibrobacterota bacterium]
MDKLNTILGLTTLMPSPDLPMTPEEEEFSQSETRYETSLAEFPLFLLNVQSLPKGLDCLNYSDSITVNKQRVERHWKVSWSKKYGPGTQSTAETFFALFQFWADTGFSYPWIHFDTINNLLKRRCISNGSNNYKRVIDDLHCLCNLYIEAKNAFYDSVKKQYVDASFHLFEGLVLEKDTDGSPDRSSKGFIRASDTLYHSVQKNIFQLGINEEQFFKLPGIQQRLFLYLRKIFIFQKFHVRTVQDLAQQIPLYNLNKWSTRQILKKAVEGLMASGLLPQLSAYRFIASESSGKDLIRFERFDAKQPSLFKEAPPAIQAKNEEADYRFSLITDVLKDAHSYPFYRKVSGLLDMDSICRALSEAKETCRQAAQDNKAANAARIFTSRVKTLAAEQGIDL